MFSSPPTSPLEIMPDLGGAIPKVDDAPWPGFPADLMSIALVVATQAAGTVLFHEKMFESRLYFVDKLIGMGARIILCDPHRAVIVGPVAAARRADGKPRHPGRDGAAHRGSVRAGPERTSATSGQIDRGYEKIEEKLRELGANIRRVD